MSNSVVVVATGGTIACTTNADGARVPTLSAAELVARCGTTEPVRVHDAASLDSSSMTLRDIDELASLIELLLDDATVTAIIITHGTDSMAETALALDLVHADPRPVILTGAQLPADHPKSDGAGNLFRAIEAGADRLRRGTGVLVHVGETLPARGLYKQSTETLTPFALTTDRPQPRPAPVPRAPLAGMQVPIVRAWPGADGAIVDAVAGGAADASGRRPDGIVVEALGSGNVSDQMGAALGRAVKAGIPVVVATSVPTGGVEFAYGGAGGGATLGQLGAIAAGPLSPGQARIALATALATGTDPRQLF